MINTLQIKFSIITPVYNREDCIGRCIDSVIKQHYSNLEMWIIDDGSTDQTSEIIKEYQKEHNFIQYHKFDQNKGVNSARNYGIQNSHSDFVILLDSDDYFTDNALNIISDTIQKYPEYKQYLFAQDDRMFYYEQNKYLSNEISILSFSDFILRNIHGDFTHAIATDLIKKYPFSEKLRIYEVLNFFQIYKDSVNQLFCNKIIVNRERDRDDSVTLEYKLINADSIEKKYTANATQLKFFIEDYLKYDKKGDFVQKLIKETYLLGLATGNYELDFLESFINKWRGKIPTFYKLIRYFRLGYMVRIAINTYSKLKMITKK